MLQFKQKLKELNKNKDYIDNIIRKNADKANHIADRILKKVQKKVGFPVR